ncbi:MAG TPA: DsbA family protein [Sphingomonadaceae bacterium]|nr:DsbA family protein [Sphingomonadaceae bacterium]
MAGISGVVAGAAAMALLGAAGAGNGAVAGEPDRAAVEQIVRAYILAHPEIIPEAMERLHAKQMAQQIDAHRKAIETPFAGAWAGAEQGDVTLVEFFDYACGFCKASVPDVDRLLAEDKNLKVVFRELPILGDGSEEAARVSLAAARQNKFLDFHRHMYAAARPTTATIAAARTATGLDAAQAARDSATMAVHDEIAQNLDLARTLGLTGTPSFVIGDRILSGAVGYEELKKAVAEARARPKS